MHVKIVLIVVIKKQVCRNTCGLIKNRKTKIGIESHLSFCYDMYYGTDNLPNMRVYMLQNALHIGDQRISGGKCLWSDSPSHLLSYIIVTVS